MTNKQERIENAARVIAATIMKQLMQETTYSDLAEEVIEADDSLLAKENDRLKAEIAELVEALEYCDDRTMFKAIQPVLNKHRKADKNE